MECWRWGFVEMVFLVFGGEKVRLCGELAVVLTGLWGALFVSDGLCRRMGRGYEVLIPMGDYEKLGWNWCVRGCV